MRKKYMHCYKQLPLYSFFRTKSRTFCNFCIYEILEENNYVMYLYINLHDCMLVFGYGTIYWQT